VAWFTVSLLPLGQDLEQRAGCHAVTAVFALGGLDLGQLAEVQPLLQGQVVRCKGVSAPLQQPDVEELPGVRPDLAGPFFWAVGAGPVQVFPVFIDTLRLFFIGAETPPDRGEVLP